VLCETGYILTDEDGLSPDVSFVLNEQIASLDPDEIRAIAPALAVAAVSSESAERLEQKIELYLANGTRTVLVLYPSRKPARVHSRIGASRPLRGDDFVEIDWMPGFSVAASRFFERP
jgi:Uma2 family endonuclease